MPAVSLIFALCITSIAVCHGQISFDLSKYNPSNKTTHIQQEFVNLTQGTTQINVLNAEDPVGFFIVQVHTQLINVTLSSTPENETGTFISGTNVGLFGNVQISLTTTTFYATCDQNTQALVVITVYQPEDPIPGGCNLSFDTLIAPYQKVSRDDDLVIVQSQAPAATGFKCELDDIEVEMYHFYLRENDYDASSYFEGLQKMLTVDEIRENGYKVRLSDGYYKYRKLYSLYRGVGHMFAIVATFKNRSSAYVPAASYGCDIRNIPESCNGPDSANWKLICALMLIVGTFMCFSGHKFFRFTLYLMGSIIGIFVTYTVLSLNDNISIDEKSTASLLIGFIYGSVWLFIWWKYGLPLLSISMIFFLAGFLIGSIVFYSGVADFHVFHSDVNFWMTDLSIILTCAIMWTMFTLQGHIFACAFLGSYGVVTASSYYIGGNLQYIVINKFRRIIVPNFNMATIDPPFQLLDGAQVLLWLVLVGSGCWYQLREQRGKPPFPPPRYVTVRDGISETTPLLRDNPPPYTA